MARARCLPEDLGAVFTTALGDEPPLPKALARVPKVRLFYGQRAGPRHAGQLQRRALRRM